MFRNVGLRPQSLRHKRTGQSQEYPGFIVKILSLVRVSHQTAWVEEELGRSHLNKSPRKLRACLFPTHPALQPLRESPICGVSVLYRVSIVIYKAFQNTSTCHEVTVAKKKTFKSQKLCWKDAALGLPTAHPSSMKNWEGICQVVFVGSIVSWGSPVCTWTHFIAYKWNL